MNYPSVVVYVCSFYLVFGFEEWFLVWFGLELNMISFLMLSHSLNNILVVEGMAKYFFIQSLASGLLVGMMYLGWNSFVWVTILVLKMGLGPFFGWYIKVVKSFTWGVNYILMVFQSIMLLMLVLEVCSLFLFYMGMISMVVGVFGVFGQVNLKALLGYSSVFHGGWMFMLMEEKGSLWWIYFFFYGLMMLSIINLVVKQMFMGIYVSIGCSKNSFILMMLNLGGIPPFTGFIMSWLTFYYLWGFDYGLLVLMVLMSLALLYAYFRFIYDIIMGGLFYVSWSIFSMVYFLGESLSLVGLFVIFMF
uniref:NADH-ubiquinone oxidoreductase chain 2 n=1 Tax=Parachtes teruelis TaxID=1110494 RepID=A0A516IML0_9ARAC|nr:NADH dehydrogenase subunit 2 [Parachtes teruelis]